MASPSCQTQFSRLSLDSHEAQLEAVVQRSQNTDFFAVRSDLLEKPKATVEIDEWNSELEAALKLSLPPSGNRKNGMTRDEAKKLYQQIDCHPVAGMKQVKKYDPQGNFGFCFGRATATHLEALRQRLSRSRILKIWGVGPMKGGWGHHVATLVAAKEGGWWAIDPEIGHVVSGVDWVKWLREEQENSAEPLVFFLSEAERFGPLPGKYKQIDLFGTDESDIYNGYFRDLIRKSPDQKKSAP